MPALPCGTSAPVSSGTSNKTGKLVHVQQSNLIELGVITTEGYDS